MLRLVLLPGGHVKHGWAERDDRVMSSCLWKKENVNEEKGGMRE
jgi:hypothetical protein